MSELCQQLSAYRSDRAAAVAFGVFDGVHLGHQSLINTLRVSAKERGLSAVVVTLSNHPLSVLRPGLQLRLLTSPRERLDLLSASGPDAVLPVTFTHELSLLSARDFMAALTDCVGMEHFVAGPDVALGHARQGTLPVLTELGVELGYSLETVEQFSLGGIPVRSTAIRESLRDGKIELAQKLLGRPFSLEGSVVEGEGRGGGLLGYPTANIGVDPLQALPADGIYATWISFGGRKLPAATSVGSKPTFHDEFPTVVEAFVLDFEGNLYGEQVKLEFVGRLRDQEHFESVGALVTKMEHDVSETRRMLTGA